MISKTLLFKLKNHDVYLIDNVSFSYYIAIPSNSVDTIITIEFTIDDVSDYMRVKDNFLISNFEKLDHIPNSLVIPVVKDTTNIENLLSKVLNNAYLILKQEGKNVSQKIILIRNGIYEDKLSSFAKRFESRCSYKTIQELIAEIINYNKIETTSMNFVVSKKEDPPKIQPEVELKSNLVLDEITLEDEKEPVENAGYVSYWLLGTITIVISIVILYLLI